MTGCRGSRANAGISSPTGSRIPTGQRHRHALRPARRAGSHSRGARSTGPPSRTARDHRRGRRLPAGARHTRGGAPCAPDDLGFRAAAARNLGAAAATGDVLCFLDADNHPRTPYRPAALPVARSAVRGGDGGTRRHADLSGIPAPTSDRGGRPGARADRARVVARGVRAQWGSAARRRSVLIATSSARSSRVRGRSSTRWAASTRPSRPMGEDWSGPTGRGSRAPSSPMSRTRWRGTTVPTGRSRRRRPQGRGQPPESAALATHSRGRLRRAGMLSRDPDLLVVVPGTLARGGLRLRRFLPRGLPAPR